MICILIRNEQDMLPRCLSALSDQITSAPFEVLLFLNNCTDASEEIATGMQRDAQVVVSGRISGRAEGGMADTLRRRSRRPDAWLDTVVEAPQDRQRRACARR